VASSEKCSSDDGIAFDEKVEPSLIEVQGVAAGTWDLKDTYDIDPSSSRRVKCRRLVKAHVTIALRRFVLRPEPISSSAIVSILLEQLVTYPAYGAGPVRPDWSSNRLRTAWDEVARELVQDENLVSEPFRYA
jgi:hypothetical protein